MPRQRLFTKYTGPLKGGDADRGFFYFQIQGLDTLLSVYRDSSEIFRRELSKELELLKAQVEETYKGYAPYKAGGSSNDKYSWSRENHLRDSIQARKALKATALELRMAWWGHLTTDGRAAQGQKGSPYRIELPGGEVIYRMRTRAATTVWPDDPYATSDIAPDRRMNWPKEAYKDLTNTNVFRDATKQLAERFRYAVFREQERTEGEAAAAAAWRRRGYRNMPRKPTESYASKLRTARERRRNFNADNAPKQRAKVGRPRKPKEAVERAHTYKLRFVEGDALTRARARMHMQGRTARRGPYTRQYREIRQLEARFRAQYRDREHLYSPHPKRLPHVAGQTVERIRTMRQKLHRARQRHHKSYRDRSQRS